MEYTIHNTIPVIVINLLTTKFFGGFSFRKTSGVQTMKTNFILHIGIFAILTTMPNIANAGTGELHLCRWKQPWRKVLARFGMSRQYMLQQWWWWRYNAHLLHPRNMQTDHNRLGVMRFRRQFVCRMRRNRRMRGQSVCAWHKLSLCCRRIRQPQRIKQNRLCTMPITRNIGCGFDQSIRLLYPGRNHRFGQYWHV